MRVPRSIAIISALLALLVIGLAFAKGKNVITKDQLVEMFQNMPDSPEWDTSKPMLWGFFFTDPSKDNLQGAVPLLEQQGYRFVDIFLSEKDDSEEPDLWWLHVEKVEVHTPETLDQRNQVLYKFADSNNLGAYDGMDVGPAPAQH